MKTVDNETNSAPVWPDGKYCIFRYGGSCPIGLEIGSIHFDDDDRDSKVTGQHGGVVPDEVEQRWYNVRLYYCCKNTGNIVQPIELPYDKPFYLFRKDPTGCQQVRGMTAAEEFVHFNTHDGNDNSDSSTGSIPYTSTPPARITAWEIHYCYYCPI
ncbi:uncharacterized protein LOC141898350 [Tubulanus polymorphus]|uniref:uncharacterized protein LOC141898350 n=1 Tax=Tubulanus polymorphus TaxID=672921 RepID=UPI003DA6271D